jgi:hypothetical protein
MSAFDIADIGRVNFGLGLCDPDAGERGDLLDVSDGCAAVVLVSRSSVSSPSSLTGASAWSL